MRFPAPAVNAEDESKPVFTLFAETGPADGPAQQNLVALQPCLLFDLTAHASHDVLLAIQLAAQAVELSEVRIIRPAVAMDQQDLPLVRREAVTQRGQDRGIRHGSYLRE